MIRRSFALAVTLSAWPAGPVLRAADVRGGGQVAIVQLRVLEGEGAIHVPASRSWRPIVVQVTEETGQPVAGAAVSFRLPEDAPTGVFASGLKTEIQITDAEGRASVWGIQWGKTTGLVELRITAVKGQARAGIVCPQWIEASAPAGAPSARSADPRPGAGRKWIAAAVAAGGVLAGGMAIRLARQGSAPTAAAAHTPSAAPAAVQIGPPAITVGRP